jgi:hypothetical protein
LTLASRLIWKRELLTWSGLSDWLTGLLIDLVAVGLGVAGAIFVAGDYYRLSAVDGSVALAFVVTMLSANFIFRKVASWCRD